MNRDKNLQRLILVQLRDRVKPPELSKYTEQEILYNGSLLIRDGYVDGSVIENASGIPTRTSMTVLTSKGHDWLDSTDPSKQQSITMPPHPIPNASSEDLRGLLSQEGRNMLGEAIAHVRLAHQKEVEEAIRNLNIILANQGLKQSSIANQEGVSILEHHFNRFVDQVWVEAKRVMDIMLVEAKSEQQILDLLNSILDVTIQADSQLLLNVAESNTAPMTVGLFQQRCQQSKARIATAVKIYCRSLVNANNEKAQKSISADLPSKKPAANRRTLTVLFTDIEDYSKHVSQDEAAMLKMLDTHNTVIEQCIDVNSGTRVKRIGDSFMAYFHSAIDSVRCGFSIQKEVTKLNEREGANIKIRIGINTGDVQVAKDGDLDGAMVNIAKRIEGAARAGGVCISDSVLQTIAYSERKQFTIQDAGKLELKGSPEPIQCWHVLIEPVPLRQPQPLSRQRDPERHQSDLATPHASVALLARISPDARKLLVESVGSVDGNVSKVRTSMYGEVVEIHTANQEFLGNIEDNRNRARWIQAFNELVRAGCFSATMNSGIFAITHLGYELADTLKNNSS